MKLLTSAYQRWLYSWEERLATRSTDRVKRPFEWGLEWTADWPAAAVRVRNGHSEQEYLEELSDLAVRDSDQFFSYARPRDFHTQGDTVRFTSPVRSPHPANNTVAARWFPAVERNGRPSRKGVVLLPHWNSQPHQHVALCRGIQRLGISVLRISLPYHDSRMPAETHRADYAVSSNIARTVDATRQAVIDVRCCLDWLEETGHESLGLVGTSLGSCYAFLASAHDARARVNVFNHCSTYFADVVWTGLSTRHIRTTLEGNIDLDALRRAWLAISPVSYIDKFAALDKKAQFAYTTYDTTFLPEFSADIVARIRERDPRHRIIVLPCGHYTLGETPYKYIIGYHICSFLKRHL